MAKVQIKTEEINPFGVFFPDLTKKTQSNLRCHGRKRISLPTYYRINLPLRIVVAAIIALLSEPFHFFPNI